MTNFEKHITNSAKEYSLSSDEKARMQRSLKEYMSFKPLPRANAAVVISYSWISILHRPIAASLVLVLVFGSGVSFAAENALPGDALYTVKTGVNEPLRVVLATNAEAKANVQIELAERRIEEATVLAVEGRLDESTQEELASRFESHAAAAAESIVAADEDDASASTELASRFETRLAAHESVLSEVEIEMEGEDDNSNSHRFTDAIRATNMVLAEARFNRSNVAVSTEAAADIAVVSENDASMAMQAEPAAMTMSLAVATEPAETTRSAKFAANVEVDAASSPDARTISRMKNAAEKSLKAAQKTLRNAKSLSAEAKVRAEADIKLAGELIVNGNDSMDDEASAEAFAAFEESLRVSEQANVYIKASPSLEKARARNSSRNKNSEAQKSVNAVVEISLPGTSVNATATIPASPPADRGGSDDGPTHDANDDRGEDEMNHDVNDDNGGDRPKDESDDGVLKNLLKFNISN